MTRFHHWIVRTIHTRHIVILGWPSTRMRAVWWLYEHRSMERWRDLREKLKLTTDAVKAWISSARS